MMIRIVGYKIMKKILSVITFLTMCGVAHAENGLSKVSFHQEAGSRESHVVEKLYAPYLSKHSNTNLETAVVDLDGKGIGSIFVRFVSNQTCVDVNRCLTTIVRYNTATKGWDEIWSKHTRDVWIGAISPGSIGAGMREIYSDDGLMYKWFGPHQYVPDIRSVGPLWDSPVGASPIRVKYAMTNPPLDDTGDLSKAKDVTIQQIPVKLGPVGIQWILIYNSITFCGQVGCPFIVIDGTDNGGYKTIGGGSYAGAGAMVNAPGASDQPFAPFAVQEYNGIEYYSYQNGRYAPYKTTYLSAVTRSP